MTRYFGKICKKHPELKGERIFSNRSCVACKNIKRHMLTRNKYHSDVEWRSKYLDMKSKQKARYNRYSFYVANYRAAKKQRTPSWADMEKIKQIYREARKLGLTVDHIIPLQGVYVSGFHVETNLRMITQRENDIKSNKLIESLL